MRARVCSVFLERRGGAPVSANTQSVFVAAEIHPRFLSYHEKSYLRFP